MNSVAWYLDARFTAPVTFAPALFFLFLIPFGANDYLWAIEMMRWLSYAFIPWGVMCSGFFLVIAPAMNKKEVRS